MHLLVQRIILSCWEKRHHWSMARFIAISPTYTLTSPLSYCPRTPPTATEKCCCTLGLGTRSASHGRHRTPPFVSAEFCTRCSERESDAMQRQKKICAKCFQPASTTNCAHCFQRIVCAEPKTTTIGLRSTPRRQSDDSDSCNCQQSRITFSQLVHDMVVAIDRPSK